jgi:hypothetical protein
VQIVALYLLQDRGLTVEVERVTAWFVRFIADLLWDFSPGE